MKKPSKEISEYMSYLGKRSVKKYPLTTERAKKMVEAREKKKKARLNLSTEAI